MAENQDNYVTQIRSYLQFLRFSRTLREDHAQARPVTAEEWNDLFNGMARHADRLQEMFGDVGDAFLRHVEGIVTLPQFDEDLEGRHGFKVDDMHAAWHYVQGIWHKLDFSGTSPQPMLDEEIIQLDEYPIINEDFYAADAHIVRVIYLMLKDLGDRVDNLDLRFTKMGDDLIIIEQLVTDYLPTEYEKIWLGFMNDVVYYIQPVRPPNSELQRWVNYRAVWINSSRLH